MPTGVQMSESTYDLVTELEKVAESAFGFGLITGWFLAALCILVLKQLYASCKSRRLRIAGTVSTLVFFGIVNLLAVEWAIP